MSRRWSLLIVLLLLTGCKNDEVQTYRLAKDSAGMPPEHPPISGKSSASPAMTPMPGMAMPDDSSRRNISWKTPAGWMEQPASQMRVGSFFVLGKNGQTSDVSIVPLGGMAGTDLDNVNRWRGQIDLEPISQAELSKILQKTQAGSKNISLVNLVSREPLIDQKYKKRLMSAWFQEAGQVWFVKMTGEDSNVESARPDFLKFIGSIKIRS